MTYRLHSGHTDILSHVMKSDSLEYRDVHLKNI